MLWTFLILITPYCLGLPWRKIGGAKGRGASFFFVYVTGYVIRLALFHLICFPMVLLRNRFSMVCHVFTPSLLLLSILCAVLGRKNICAESINPWKWLKSHTVSELIYLTGFLAIFVFQIVQIIRMDITYMGYDNATYTTYGSNALTTDLLFQTEVMTGTFAPLSGRQAFMTALIYNAWITRMTGIPITMVMRTVQAVYVFILAFMVYAYMAEDLFASRDNRYGFLLILSFLYLFGYYSHYSATFRLLGPSSEGKAIATTVLTPLLLILMKKKMTEQYDWKVGFLLMLFSHAATGLSLWGMGMVFIVVAISVFLSLFRKNRNWKHLLYIVWTGLFPALYLALYMTILT